VSRLKPRQIVLRLLQKTGPGSDYLEALLDKELSHSQIEAPDRRLVQELAFGMVRWQKTLDWLIDRKSAQPAQNPVSRWLLRMGLYQMFWLDRIPDYAAVNETVDLAKQLGLNSQAGFINALLRGYGREMAATRQLLTDLKDRNFALGFSHPEFLCRRWETRWGKTSLKALLEWNNTPPLVFARVNPLRTTVADLLQLWQTELVEYQEIHRDWFGQEHVFELLAHRSLAELPSFQQGRFYVQDPGTLLAVNLLNPQPGDTVLDLCAAPGGKTALLAGCMQNQGRILAIEPQAQRLARLRENCQRLGVACAEFAPQLEAYLAQAGGLLFDRILIDAPCSNSGVMRRRIELRWRLRLEELERLQRVQLELLRQAARRLKPGGTLVYSTCSLEPEENSEVVRIFLSEQPSYRLKVERQLLPFVDKVDGSYAGVFHRQST
jgi:16S rRNA (cytosine967-C5)-methyltransferase